MTAFDLVIGYCHGGTVRAEFAASLLGVVMESPVIVETVLALESGPNISTARNKIADDFLRKRRAPWLLMCDTDMTFKPDAPAKLIAAARPYSRPVVGGLCMSLERGVPVPTMYELEAADERLAFRRVLSPAEDRCVQVAATGAAFLLMHRQALQDIEAASNDPAAPWFRESPVGAPLALMGEDMTFCLRCAAASIPVHVHTGVKVGHMKTVQI